MLRRAARSRERIRPGHRGAGTPRLRARNVELMIAGEGPSRDALETLAAARGVAARVHLLGHREDLPGVLRTADAFVVSSLHEGMSNVLMEAMALGLPCVTTPVGGVEELVVHGRDGTGRRGQRSRADRSGARPTAGRSPRSARRLGTAARRADGPGVLDRGERPAVRGTLRSAGDTWDRREVCTDGARPGAQAKSRGRYVSRCDADERPPRARASRRLSPSGARAAPG